MLRQREESREHGDEESQQSEEGSEPQDNESEEFLLSSGEVANTSTGTSSQLVSRASPIGENPLLVTLASITGVPAIALGDDEEGDEEPLTQSGEFLCPQHAQGQILICFS